MSALSIRDACKDCDLYMERSSRCRAVEVTDWQPAAWTWALSTPPTSWTTAITRDLPAKKRRAVAQSCGNRDAVARAYLTGVETTCGAWQPARRAGDTPLPEPEPAIFDLDDPIDFGEEE